MQLIRAVVRQFQSIEKADLPLAPFTVVVGASNSGKSAFLRALRTLAYNTSSPSVVRVGEKSAFVALQQEDGREVWLERGASLSTYGVGEERFPKSGVSVPAEVQKVLRFPEVEGESLNFAFQFDRPFLLDASGTKVAKVLGDLTNINVIYEAVREANRRKLEASGRLKVRRADEKDLAVRMEGFKSLRAEKAQLVRAEEALARVREAEVACERLKALVEQSEVIEMRLEELRSSGGGVQVDVEGLEERSRQVAGLRKLLSEIERGAKERVAAKSALVGDREEEERARERFEEALHASGECPLCGVGVA